MKNKYHQIDSVKRTSVLMKIRWKIFKNAFKNGKLYHLKRKISYPRRYKFFLTFSKEKKIFK